MNEPFVTQCKPFADLSAQELYAIMQLRNEVFVVEQDCVYQDADGKDPYCHHLMIFSGEKLAAYTRLLPPGVSYPQMSIGRVVTSPLFRREGLGRELMLQSIDRCYKLFGDGEIRIGAQLYLEHFYGSLGFVQTGGMYLEDNIEHIEMTKPTPSSHT